MLLIFLHSSVVFLIAPYLLVAWPRNSTIHGWGPRLEDQSLVRLVDVVIDEGLVFEFPTLQVQDGGVGGGGMMNPTPFCSVVGGEVGIGTYRQVCPRGTSFHPFQDHPPPSIWIISHFLPPIMQLASERTTGFLPCTTNSDFSQGAGSRAASTQLAQCIITMTLCVTCFSQEPAGREGGRGGVVN